jgi:hypothetical protein
VFSFGPLTFQAAIFGAKDEALTGAELSTKGAAAAAAGFAGSSGAESAAADFAFPCDKDPTYELLTAGALNFHDA